MTFVCDASVCASGSVHQHTGIRSVSKVAIVCVFVFVRLLVY